MGIQLFNNSSPHQTIVIDRKNGNLIHEKSDCFIPSAFLIALLDIIFRRIIIAAFFVFLEMYFKTKLSLSHSCFSLFLFFDSHSS